MLASFGDSEMTQAVQDFRLPKPETRAGAREPRIAKLLGLLALCVPQECGVCSKDMAAKGYSVQIAIYATTN